MLYPLNSFSKDRMNNITAKVLLVLLPAFCFAFCSMMMRSTTHADNQSRLAPRKLYCFWNGDKPMSENRRRCFNTLWNSGLEVILVTDHNLSKFILPEAPLHEGYKYLSAAHKSDYLRAYFMHFHGGGYSDLKKITKSWLPALDELNKNTSAYAVGYAEVSRNDVAVVPNKLLNKRMHENWDSLIGICQMICRPRSRFTSEWYRRMINTMDANIKSLRKNPARDVSDWYTKDYPYPFRWAQVGGEAFHPACYQFRKHIRQSLPIIQWVPYR